MTILKMQERHLPALAALEALCFSEPWSQQALAQELENPTAFFFVAEQDGQVLGYAGMHRVLDESYMDNLAVFPEHRGKGAAKALMQALLEAASADHGRFLTLEVRDSNTAAITLYTGLRFETVGRRKNFYVDPREDAVLMTRTFSE